VWKITSQSPVAVAEVKLSGCMGGGTLPPTAIQNKNPSYNKLLDRPPVVLGAPNNVNRCQSPVGQLDLINKAPDVLHWKIIHKIGFNKYSLHTEQYTTE
jgi:hypothetical protein